jgi:DNA-binding XRE family transcriptional regulator
VSRLLERLERQEGAFVGPLPPPDSADWQDMLTWVARRTNAPLGLQNAGRPTVADQLLVARLARQVTQEALADRAGVRRATVADVEAGRIDPKASTLTALAEALAVTIWLR